MSEQNQTVRSEEKNASRQLTKAALSLPKLRRTNLDQRQFEKRPTRAWLEDAVDFVIMRDRMRAKVSQ